VKPKLVVVAVAVGVALAAADLARSLEPAPWWRGNTHAHTNLCDHADASPASVTSWYLDHGYHFLVLSEHNRFIDPATVPLPPGARKDFTLIPGEELTGPRGVHTTALGVRELVDGTLPRDTPARDVIRAHVERTLAAGGEPILNHPNYLWATTAADLLAVERLELFELHNGHPAVKSEGDAQHPGLEEVWDTLLGAGRVAWGVASDDMHHLHTWGGLMSNPGRGWIMVQAPTLTPDAIVAAIRAGRFYASSGVTLTALRTGPRWLELEVDEPATRRELEGGLLVGRAGGDADGIIIEAIGRGGEVLSRVEGPRARFTLADGQPYLRARVTWTRAGLRYFAWSQPIFGDERARAR
jgi:hypothetical protein